jgi:hypothetical protein
MYGEIMNKGFLVMAQNSQTDYVRMAYVLAMSLKISQSKYNKMSIIVNKGEGIRRKKIFDKIIYVDNVESKWKVDNKWQYFWLSPYDETIVLDADMLFFHDISTWWEILSDKEIEFATHTKNYRGKTTTSDYYRKVFTKNKLPNLHTALFYFKKTALIEKYFEMVQLIFENWEVYYERFLKDPPKFLSGDVSYALAAKIIFNRKWDSCLTFTHMRSRLQDDDIVSDWNKELPSFFTTYHGNIELKINNFNQMYPFHYIKKNFLSEEVVELYEDKIHLL